MITLYKDDLYCTIGFEQNDRTLFRSVFSYPDSILDYILDNSGSVAGYKGPVKAETVFIDIDKKEYPFGIAKHETIKIVESLLKEGIPEESIGIYFSGSKGFHIHIHGSVLGEEFSEEVPGRAKAFVQYIAPGQTELIDYSIYNHNSIIRLSNSKHPKTGLYKIYLTLEELYVILSSDIRKLAKSPRREVALKPTTEVFVKQYKTDNKESVGFVQVKARPCIAAMKREKIPTGLRDHVLLRLVSYMMNNEGNTPEMVYAALSGPWLDNIDPPTKITPKVVQDKIDRCPSYYFGCNDHIMQAFCKNKCPFKKKKNEDSGY